MCSVGLTIPDFYHVSLSVTPHNIGLAVKSAVIADAANARDPSHNKRPGTHAFISLAVFEVCSTATTGHMRILLCKAPV